MIIHKLDYVLESEHAAQRDAAQCAAYARPARGVFSDRLRRLAKRVAGLYLTHQNWKAHEGVYTTPELDGLTTEAITETQQSRRRSLKKLAGVKMSEAQAQTLWPRLLDHKWYLGERLGRDVGLKVAALDYFENIERPQPPARFRLFDWQGLPPRLPMMLPLGERA